MDLLADICAGLPEGNVLEIKIGSHWTAVVVETEHGIRCGLASNPFKGLEVDDRLRLALEGIKKEANSRDLCRLAQKPGSVLTSVGLAAVNALIPPEPARWVEVNAGEVIAARGKDKRVALVGHFPFIPALRNQVGELHVLELRPREGDLHADLAPDIIPGAAVVAITSMTIINGTLEHLLDLCSPEAVVILLGPSTPLSPVLFRYGIDLVCGSIVEQIVPVLQGVEAGLGFQKIKPLGVRLVAIENPGMDAR